MNAQAEFVRHCLELMSGLDGVYAKRMFGGQGVFREGLMFALVANAELYLKVDDGNRDSFTSLDLEAFTVNHRGHTIHMSYYLCPEEAFQDEDSMTKWGTSAWEAAVRQDDAKPRSKRKRQPS